MTVSKVSKYADQPLVSGARFSAPAPAPTGDPAADFDALTALFLAAPVDSMIVLAAKSTYTVHPGFGFLKSGQTIDLNQAKIKRAPPIVVDITATMSDGAASVAVSDVSQFRVGMTVSVGTLDRITAWANTSVAIASIDTVNKVLTFTGSGRGLTNLGLRNIAGIVASVAPGAGGGFKLFTAGPMLTTRYSAPIAATSSFILNINELTGYTNTAALVVGATVTGLTSGHTAQLVQVTPSYLIVTNPRNGAAYVQKGFTPGETLQVGGQTVAVADAAYITGTTGALGHYCYPGVFVGNGYIDGNSSVFNTVPARWEVFSEVDLATYNGGLPTLTVLNSVCEGVILSGRNIDAEDLVVWNSSGNALHFSDYDGMTGCWDVQVPRLMVNGACNGDNYWMNGHADGCVSWSNNTRRITISNFDISNSKRYGFGSIDYQGNSENTLHDGKIRNCAAGPWFITTPANTELSGIKMHDIEVIDCGLATSQVFNGTAQGVTANGGAMMGGASSGEASTKGLMVDSLVHDIAFTFTSQPALLGSGSPIVLGPFRNSRVGRITARYIRGVGNQDGMQLIGAINSDIGNIIVTDVSTGTINRACIKVVGNLWDNTDMYHLKGSGGQRGVDMAVCQNNLPAGLWRNMRCHHNSGVNNQVYGLVYSSGDYAGDMVSDGDGASYTLGQAPASWVGLYYSNPNTKTSPNWIRTTNQLVNVPTSLSTGSGATYNFTVSGGVVTAVSITAGGASYTNGTARWVVPNPNGRPAVITATVTGNVITDTCVVVDAGDNYGGSGAGTIGSSAAYSVFISTSSQNIEFGGSYNMGRSPTFGSSLVNILGRNCLWSFSGWAVPAANSGITWQNCFTQNQRVQAAITVPASTVAYDNPLSDDILVAIVGGTISLVEVTGKLGTTTWITAGTGPGLYPVGGGARLRITYSAAPTSMTRMAV